MFSKPWAKVKKGLNECAAIAGLIGVEIVKYRHD